MPLLLLLLLLWPDLIVSLFVYIHAAPCTSCVSWCRSRGQFGHVSTLGLLLDYAREPPPAFVRALPVALRLVRDIEEAELAEENDRDSLGPSSSEEEDEEEKEEVDKGEEPERAAEEAAGGEEGTESAAAAAPPRTQKKAKPPRPDAAAKLDAALEAAGRETRGGLYLEAMLEARDASGWTPLMVAAAHGQVAI